MDTISVGSQWELIIVETCQCRSTILWVHTVGLRPPNGMCSSRTEEPRAPRQPAAEASDEGWLRASPLDDQCRSEDLVGDLGRLEYKWERIAV